MVRVRVRVRVRVTVRVRVRVTVRFTVRVRAGGWVRVRECEEHGDGRRGREGEGEAADELGEALYVARGKRVEQVAADVPVQDLGQGQG